MLSSQAYTLLMGDASWRDDPVPDEVCFEALKASIKAVPQSSKIFIDAGKLEALCYGQGSDCLL